MFGRKRKRFNGDVDQKIVCDYGIQTRGNPDWPGPLAYLEFLDTPWRNNWNADEAALFMAMNFYLGLVDAGRYDEAATVHDKIRAVAEANVSAGQVGQAKWEHFQAVASRKLTAVDKGEGG